MEPMRVVHHSLVLLLLGLLALPCRAQDSLAWRIKKVETTDPLPSKLQRLVKHRFDDAKSADNLQEIKTEVASQVVADGYQEFSVDTFFKEDRTLRLTVYPGRRYFYDTIRIPGLNEVDYGKVNFERLQRKHAPFSSTDFQGRMIECLKAYQNKGFPFAAFDSLEMTYRQGGEDSIYASVDYQFAPGKLVTIDSVIIDGKVREKTKFIENLVSIYPGDAYSQENIDRARRLLNSSPYFKNAQPAKVEFLSETKAKVTLKLESRKSGKFDVLLGILPPSGSNAKLQFTGLIDFQLVSPLFKAGEMLEFRFDKLVGSSQKLRLRFAMPYLFGSPMGIDGEFNLMKQDTSFLTRYFKVGVPYAFSPSLSVRVYYKNKASSLISTRRYELDTSLVPPVLDGKDQTYGIGFSFENLDDRFSPTRGFRIRADGGIGKKKVVRNPRLTENVYEGITVNLPKKESEIRIEWYQKYSKRMVLMLANSTYWLDQKQYFQNDLMQVGGSRSIRGFNENQFFTNFYSAITIENRFLLEERSYLFVFSDIAYLEDKAGLVKVMRPWGLGLGLTYETKAGMLSITYAAGQVAGIPFQPSRGKIHIGLVNQF
ncbi:MAG: BamA/TamA family outer membrane protein [Bacteroidetes bacterium]|nr:BamA/TamA family outer membrane protein [Bacteroidota bacterium]